MHTLSRWVREAHVSWQETPTPTAEAGRAMPVRRPQDWTAEEKYAVMIEAASLSDEELGAFVREKGLRQANLKQWRQEMLTALRASKARPSRPSAETRRIRELERELARKEKALAEAAALLLLKKKSKRCGGTRTTPQLRGEGADLETRAGGRPGRCPTGSRCRDPRPYGSDPAALADAEHGWR